MSQKRKASYSQGSGKRLKKTIDAIYRSRAPTASRQATRQVIRSIAMEKKGVDTEINTGPVTTNTASSANAFTLNTPQQGSGYWQRVGRKIHLESLRIKGSILNIFDQGLTVSGASAVCRMVVVWDKQSSGGLQFDGIFGHTNNLGTESSDILDPISFDQMERFVILRDKVWECNPPSISNAEADDSLRTNTYFDEYIDLKGKVTTFDNSTSPGAVADIASGAIYVYFRVSNSTNMDTFIENAHARLRYRD